jgi:hypothetical protein
MRRKLSFSFGQYTSVFKTDVYATQTYAVENIGRDYKNRNIYISSDSQAPIKPPNNYHINSEVV